MACEGEQDEPCTVRRSAQPWTRWSRSSLAGCYTFLSVLRRSRRNVEQAAEEQQTATALQIKLSELLNTPGLMRQVWGYLRMRGGLAEKVREMSAKEQSRVLGDGESGDDDNQFDEPHGAAWIPSHQDWLVTTEACNHRVKVTDVRSGATICKFGHFGHGEGQFSQPWGITVTSDSKLVIVADQGNHRVQVLQLVIAEDGQSANLEFVRSIIGNGNGSGEGQLYSAYGVALLKDAQGRQTVLVTDDNHRVSQFTLDGTFVRIFAGSSTGHSGSSNGEFKSPKGITVLEETGEVVIPDVRNHRVQIFDRDGNYVRQFGTYGEGDGQLEFPAAITSDAFGNILIANRQCRLQVFDDNGRHLCSCNGVGLEVGGKGLAWGKSGQLAVANGAVRKVRVWTAS